MNANQQFCSKCGETVGAAGTASPQSRVRRHISTLAILWILYSGFRLIFGGLLLIPAGAALRRLSQLPFFADMPIGLPGILGPLLGLVFVITLIKLVAGVALGIGLFNRASWARVLGLVLGFFALIHPLLGTALGIYTLWVLLPQNSGQEYETLTREATA
jgi:hypothetical protein